MASTTRSNVCSSATCMGAAAISSWPSWPNPTFSKWSMRTGLWREIREVALVANDLNGSPAQRLRLDARPPRCSRVRRYGCRQKLPGLRHLAMPREGKRCVSRSATGSRNRSSRASVGGPPRCERRGESDRPSAYVLANRWEVLKVFLTRPEVPIASNGVEGECCAAQS